MVLWTANTERFCDVRQGLNATADELLKSIDNNEAEISPSTIFAMASILEGVKVVIAVAVACAVTICDVLVHVAALAVVAVAVAVAVATLT